MIIDPQATAIAHLLADPALAAVVGTRIAPKHKYGLGTTQAWAAKPAAPAIVVAYDQGATINRDDDVANVRLLLRCYADSPSAASATYRLLVALERRHNGRFEVSTPHGRALVYYLVLDGDPKHDFDDDVDVDFLQVALRISVFEQPLD